MPQNTNKVEPEPQQMKRGPSQVVSANGRIPTFSPNQRLQLWTFTGKRALREHTHAEEAQK
jgi:hypothetical protein